MSDTRLRKNISKGDTCFQTLFSKPVLIRDSKAKYLKRFADETPVNEIEWEIKVVQVL